MSDKKDKSGIKRPSSKFNCPLGYNIMWWHGFEYRECPLNPSYRDMPECKSCKLLVDKKWKANKETWEDLNKKRKKSKRRRKRKNKKG